MTLYHLRDESGVEVFTGTITPAPGGGSQPGAMSSKDFLFTERPTAGTYTATLPVLAGTVVFDVILYPIFGPWATDDTAVLSVSDVAQGAGAYYDGVDLSGGLSSFYDVTNNGFGNGESYQTFTQPGAGGNAGYVFGPYGGSVGSSDDLPGPGVLYAADDTITMQVVTTLLSPPIVPAGILRVKVVYLAPAASIDASFA